MKYIPPPWTSHPRCGSQPSRLVVRSWAHRAAPIALLIGFVGVLSACGSEDALMEANVNACDFNSDCALTELCVDRRCIAECREDRDCQSNHSCVAGGCQPTSANQPSERDPDVGNTDTFSGEDAGQIRDTSDTSDTGETHTIDAGDPDTTPMPQPSCASSGCPGDLICTHEGCVDASEVEDFTPHPTDEVREGWGIIDEFGSDYSSRRLPFGETTPRYTFCGVQGYSNAGNEETANGGYGHFGLRWHCTEYALRFICEVYNVANCRELGRNGQATGHAGQWYNNSANHYVLSQLERHPNGGTVRPQPGDILARRDGGYGHVAIVRAVTDSQVTVIEQNVSQSEQDAARGIIMQVVDGRYTVGDWQGWMRVPGASPACSDPRPTLVSPSGGISVENSTPIAFAWALGKPSETHWLRIRNLDTDRIVHDIPVGSATQTTLELGPAAYRWTVYYWSDACTEPDPEGRCSADARSFTVVAGATACDANACRTRSRTSGSLCDGQDVVSCGTRDGCEIELSRTTCTAGQSCSASGTSASCTTTCTPNASRACSGNAVYNYDSCGARGSLVEQCSAGQTCTSSGGSASCTTTCTPNASRACSGNAVYNYNSCGERGSLVEQCTASQTCTGDRCVNEPRITANFTSSFSTGGSCNPTTTRAIYQGRASNISGNNATLHFQKCAGAGSPTINAGRRWWVAVGGSQYPSESDIPIYVSRLDGTVSSNTNTLTINNVPIWPNHAAFTAASCGDTRHLFLITDGGDAPGVRRWYQYRAITFTKTC